MQWSPEAHRSYCYRRTDLFVTETIGTRPLSVSADRIAMPAMRCAWLLSKLGVQDRSGDGRVFEVYPAAALSIWRLRKTKESYKGRKGRALLATMIERVLIAAPWLRFGDAAPASSFTNDHLFDALIAAMNARAAALGLTHRPPENDAATAHKEGWIALPKAGSLDQLFSQSPSATTPQ
jgi:hypothetical protein